MGEKKANSRIRLLAVVFPILFAGVLARAVYIQAAEHTKFAGMAKRQHHSTVTTRAGRGPIFDRTGVELAAGVQKMTVFADPTQIQDPREVAMAAHDILGVSANSLYPLLLNKKTQYVPFLRFADAAKAELLANKKIPGIGFLPEEQRGYPQNSVGAQIIGFAGTDNKGLVGLEYQYDHALSGRPGTQTIVQDPFGRAIDVISSRPEREGLPIFSTIDHTIQANAEAVLRATMAKWGAKDATAVVLDPRTGEVLAMAQAPGYNANNTSTASQATLRNRAVTDTYEPGSTFKLVTVTAALSEGLVTPKTRFTLPYSIHVADRTVHDAERRGTVNYNVSQILKYSSNVGAITLAEKLGAPALSRWIAKFGFGHTTGIDFPGESPGLMLPLDQWSGSTIGNVPIGQGVAVTPIQMASIYAAVANDGIWIQPHLVSKIGGRVLTGFAHRRIMSPLVDRQVKTMLTGVVEAGTGVEAAIPGYSVAGKTGTAQKPDGHGGYSKYNYVASFVGMVPAKDPKLVVLVTVDEPRGAIFGGVVAAPAFQEIAKFDLQYLEVPPDQPATRTVLGAR